MRFAYLIEPPFNFVDANGKVTGCDVELARYVFQQLNIADFEAVETEFSDLLPGLTKGNWKMTTGLFGTDERRRTAQFSRPIWALPDGLLVPEGNPMGFTGYKSLAKKQDVRVAVIRDQIQHRSAVEFGLTDQQIAVFETYTDAAMAVRDGAVETYASVGRAHGGFIEQNTDWNLGLVLVPAEEKPPAFGSFAVSLTDTNFLRDIDAVLSEFLGSQAHREMMTTFGFSQAEVDLVAG